MNKAAFVTIRLGKSSVAEIKTINSFAPGALSQSVEITVVCTQIPNELEKGVYAFIWLGSDNNKGTPTEWKQGFKAIGRVTDVQRGEKYNDESITTVDVGYIFSDSVSRLDILENASEYYVKCSAMPVIGIDDHSNQTIRAIYTDGERSDISAFLQVLSIIQDGFRDTVIKVYPEFDQFFIKANHAENIQLVDTNEDEYSKAAEYLRKYTLENGINLNENQGEVDDTYSMFQRKFSPEKLERLTDDELRVTMFYSAAKTNDSLCYWLEMDKDCKRYMGSISGGSAYKFGLFQNAETGKWMTGSPIKPQELSDQAALELAKQIRDALVNGAKIISEATPACLEDYEKLDDDLNRVIGNQFSKWAWIHKYFSLIYPRKLSSYHSDDWQRHILFSLRIKPSSKYYARSGQIAMVAKYNDWVYYQLSTVCRELFGTVKSFCRLGSTSGTVSYEKEWRKRGIIGIGWKKIGSLEDYVTDKINKKEVAERLKDEYYPTDAATASRKAGELQTFYNSNSDTVFVVMNGERPISLVDNIGAYTFDASSEMAHVKKGKWHMVFSPDERLPFKSAGHLTSCYELSDEQNLLYLYGKYYYSDENHVAIEDSYGDELEGMEETMSDRIKNCLDIELQPRGNTLHPLNFIIYGAPGTGKTYSTAEYALAIIEGTLQTAQVQG